MNAKRWKLAPPVDPEFSRQFPEHSPLVLQLLANRGLRTQAAIDEFLNPDYGEDIHDPFRFAPMPIAVERVLKAVASKESVLVYGDYDADGVCGSVLLVESLRSLGLHPDIYIPYRESEGYGLNRGAVEEIISRGVKLVVTVDCGVSNTAEVQRLVDAGVDVIVTDHHEPPTQLPPALAVLNPKIAGIGYPYHELSGTGVAFKFIQAVLSERTRRAHPEITFPAVGWEKWLLDLVSISVVTDMMSLLGENRTLVRYGLLVLHKTRRQGLRRLLETTSVPLTSVGTTEIGFLIGPRLNAAGRMDHASGAYQLLITTDAAEAAQLASDLNEQNSRRQQVTERVRSAARTQLGRSPTAPVLVVRDSSWPIGLVGLVAGKLMEEYGRPTLVIGSNEAKALVGSGRSLDGFNIVEVLGRLRERYLTRLGGHAYACGFTLKDEASFEPFRAELEALAAQELAGRQLEPTLPIDAAVRLEDVDWKLLAELEQFEPFGVDNPRPKFLAQGVEVVEAQTVGSNGQHLRLTCTHATKVVRKAIGFSFGQWQMKLKRGDRVDVVFEAGVNEWNGNREIQLKIIDLKACHPSEHGAGETMA